MALDLVNIWAPTYLCATVLPFQSSRIDVPLSPGEEERKEKWIKEKHVAEKISAAQEVYPAARKIYGLYLSLLEARFHF